MYYFISNNYYILKVDDKFYVVDKTSDCSFVFQKKGKINLNGKTYSPRYEYGGRYYAQMVGHKIDGIICRDIIDDLGGIEMENRAVVFGQQRMAA